MAENAARKGIILLADPAPAFSRNSRSQQAVAPGIRQADDLLSLVGSDVGWDS